MLSGSLTVDKSLCNMGIWSCKPPVDSDWLLSPLVAMPTACLKAAGMRRSSRRERKSFASIWAYSWLIASITPKCLHRHLKDL
ncbi:hypothetical protein DPMN_083258 [Dreissena polymorpha]|uniref:Uncharacterized protein n=1 Tax=Dreissena polymorpha TaxID=45954 RepID=A0A9D4BI93_DREPO|nr:hypothetical protein DPMN_083258 [Dreissena polymorpha]